MCSTTKPSRILSFYKLRAAARSTNLIHVPLHHIATHFHPIMADDFKPARIAGFEFSLYPHPVVTSHHTLVDFHAKLMKDGSSHNRRMTRSKRQMAEGLTLHSVVSPQCRA